MYFSDYSLARLLINKAGLRKISSRLYIKLREKAPIVKQALNKAAGHHRIGWSDVGLLCVDSAGGEKCITLLCLLVLLLTNTLISNS